MIEHLALAAEITAALLLLSLALPRSESSHSAQEGDESIGLDVLKKAEPALQTLLLLSLWAVSQNRRHHRNESDAASHSASSMLGRFMPEFGRLLVTNPADELTGLRDRHALENFFEAAEPWLAAIQYPIQVALIQPDNIDAVEEKHGHIAAEKIVQHTAELLQAMAAGNGLIVRYGFYSFGIAIVGRTQSQAVRLIESLRRRLSTEPMTIDEQSIELTFSAALPIGNPSTSTELFWELAEDGLAYSIAQGGNLGHYYDASSSTWKPMRLDTNIVGEDSIASEANVESEEASENPSISDNDVTANENVESDQANSIAAEAYERSEPTTAAAAKVEKISTGDIAALFQAAQKPVAKPAKASAASSEVNDIQSKTSTPAAAAASKVESNTMATADDIAALFASVKEAAQPVDEALKARDPIVADNAKKKYDEPALKFDDEQITTASGDEIAALFAAFKK